MHGGACHDAWNGSGTDFGASQCFPMDLDAAAAARCVHSLNLLCMHLYLTCSRLVWLPTAEQVTPVTILLCKMHSGFP